MLRRLLKSFANKGGPGKSKPSTTTVPENVRSLIKEARVLKSARHYDEACDKLLEAFSAKGAKDLSVKDRLRLPRYLQVAGRSEEGWKLLNNMLLINSSVDAQREISEEMSDFLCREKDYQQALLYAVMANSLQADRVTYEPQLLSPAIKVRIGPILCKLNHADKIDSITDAISDYLSSTAKLDLEELQSIINTHTV